jgi:hypothetical protein
MIRSTSSVPPTVQQYENREPGQKNNGYCMICYVIYNMNKEEYDTCRIMETVCKFQDTEKYVICHVNNEEYYTCRIMDTVCYFQGTEKYVIYNMNKEEYDTCILMDTVSM